MNVSVLSLGGSVIVPEKVDVPFLTEFVNGMKKFLDSHDDSALVLVCGGGAPARMYQNAVRRYWEETGREVAPDILDLIGIRATHLNGELVRSLFGALCTDPLVVNPEAEIDFTGRVLVAGGWKPGFSTDTDAVCLAKRFGSKTVINLSNTEKVYTADPRTNPDAVPFDFISWAAFTEMIGEKWDPGRNVPFDPIASKLAAQSSIRVICANGRNIENTVAILEGRDFTGTVIG